MKSLSKNVIFNVLYSALNILFPLVTSIYVAHILMPDGVGKVSYAQNIASYFIVFAALGIPTYGTREIAKAGADILKTNKIFTELVLINAISTTLSTLGYITIVFSVPQFINNKLLFFSCGLQIIFNYINIDWFYQGKEEYVYIACRSIVLKVISLVAIFLFVRNKQDYICYAFINSIALCGNYIFNIIHVRKYVRLSFRNIELKRHMRSLMIMAFTIFLSSIYSKIDITMLGFMSSETAIGLYTNAHKISDAAILLCCALTNTFLPRLSYYYETDRIKFTQLIEIGIKMLCFLSIPIVCMIFVLAPYVICILYGIAFTGAITTLRIFSVLVMIKGFGNLICYQLIICTGNEQKRLPASFLASISNIILNIILIPMYSQNGAAIASVISEIVVNWYQFVKIQRIIDIPIPKLAVKQSMFGACAMCISMEVVLLINMPDMLRFMMAASVGGIAYIAVNCILKNDMIVYALKWLKKG